MKKKRQTPSLTIISRRRRQLRPRPLHNAQHCRHQLRVDGPKPARGGARRVGRDAQRQAPGRVGFEGGAVR